MNLIGELQHAVIDSSVDSATTLRNAKVLATILGNEEFRMWVDNELKGYSGGQPLPEYREFMPHNQGTFSGPFGKQVTNYPLPTFNLPDPVKDYANTLNIAHGVKSVEGMIDLELPSIGLMVVGMVAPPSGSVSSLLGPAALR